MDHAVAALRKRAVVRDENESGSAFDLSGKQQVDHLLSGGLVEIPGWLIGDENRRVRRQRPCQRDPLLLTAGQLRWIMMQPFGKSDLREFGAGARGGIAGAGKFKWNCDVFERGHRRNEMEGLKDDADVAAAKAGQGVLVERSEIAAGDHDRAGVDALQTSEHHEQGGLAGARWADQANGLAAPYIQVDIFEDMNPGGATPE